jgi:hypothetical protein
MNLGILRWIAGFEIKYWKFREKAPSSAVKIPRPKHSRKFAKFADIPFGPFYSPAEALREEGSTSAPAAATT